MVSRARKSRAGAATFGSGQPLNKFLPFYLYCAITFHGVLMVLPLFSAGEICKCCYKTC